MICSLRTTGRTTTFVLLLLIVLLCDQSCRSAAWIIPTAASGRRHAHHRCRLPTAYRITRLHDAPIATTRTTRVVQLSGDAACIQQASRFMVESFWLGNAPVNLNQHNFLTLSENNIGRLVQQQARDFALTYGGIMGTRLLDTALLAAIDDNGSREHQPEMIGLVSLQVCILDHTTQTILNAEHSEELLNHAVAALGPQQRHLYQNSAVQQIATELLPRAHELVCCLCNLSVAPAARRRGIAARLCREAEVWAQAAGFDSLHLSVEADNTPARVLYEQRLGYEIMYMKRAAPAMRVDLDAGQFVTTKADTLILKKKMPCTVDKHPAFLAS